MSFFPSRHRCCKACSQRKVKVHGREDVEYYHRGVVCHLIGFDIAVPLDVEMLRPGEGEIIAAKRLLERVLLNYGRFFDAVVGDALYLEAPFFNFCIDHGKHVIAVIKGDQRALLQDAQGLFAQMKPGLWDEPRRLTEFWDVEGFTSAEGVKAPLRVLHAHETVTRRRRIAKQWLEDVEEHHWWWATTFPLSLNFLAVNSGGQVTTDGMWKIMPLTRSQLIGLSITALNMNRRPLRTLSLLSLLPLSYYRASTLETSNLHADYTLL